MADKNTRDVNADFRHEDVDADQDTASGEDIDVGSAAYEGEFEEPDEDENIVAGIDFGFDNLTRPAQIVKGRKIIEQIMELPDFPGRDSLVEELATGIDEFERAVRAEQFAEYELQEASRKAREAEVAYWNLVKDQPRH